MSVRAADLTAIGGFDASATRAAVSQMRVLSSVAPAFVGDAIAAL